MHDSDAAFFQRAVDELAQSLPDAALTRDPSVTIAYARDEAHLAPSAVPIALVRAHCLEEVVTTMTWASANGVPVVARGAGTGLSGGANATAGCIVLSLARMDRILDLDPVARLAVVEPGVVNLDLDRAAGREGLMYAPDPSSRDACTIGGNVATNAGGLRCVKYGATRDEVLGLEAVLADGAVLRTGGRTTKQAAGYDLTHLFVGSEGTLGIITEATLRLRSLPDRRPTTVVASFPTLAAAGQVVASTLAAGLAPSMLELLDQVVVRALESYRPLGLDPSTAAVLLAQFEDTSADEGARALESLALRNGADFVARSTTDDEAEALFDARRAAYPALERMGTTLVEDVGVPPTALVAMIESVEDVASRYDVTIGVIGHAGDGNLHPMLVTEPGDQAALERSWQAAAEICQRALALGGTITGEHGVGLLKRPWLADEIGEVGLRVHSAIKHALDPAGILNPGKAF
jgi:glycolate oxidase